MGACCGRGRLSLQGLGNALKRGWVEAGKSFGHEKPRFCGFLSQRGLVKREERRAVGTTGLASAGLQSSLRVPALLGS